MKHFVKALLFLIVVIAMASCNKQNSKQFFYPCLNNYYIVEYLDNKIILTQMTKTDTLKRINNEIFMSDGSLLFSTIRDTTFQYFENGYRIDREIFKTEEGYETTSCMYANNDMIASVSFFYNEKYEIAKIHQIEKIDYLPQNYKIQNVPNANSFYFYPQMRNPKTFYAEYFNGKIIIGSSNKQYISDTLCIYNGEMRNRDGSLLLSINGDTIMRDSSEDGEHQVEIRKIDEDRYIYSNYLKKCEALGAYVYEKKGGVTNCYLTERDDSTRIMLISYTYTHDFRILKRQSFEEVYYLLKKD